MKIGELADRCGVSPRTIRFYERRGLLPEPDRTPSGYRDYGGGAVSRLDFVRAAQASGLSLREIKQVTDLSDAGEPPCQHVTHLLEKKLAEVRDRRAQLDELEHELLTLIERGADLDPADCRPENVCHIILSRPPA